MRIDELHIAHTHESANNIYSESNTENTSYNVDITLKTKIDASSAFHTAHFKTTIRSQPVGSEGPPKL